jgi:serine/threonine-protein kinase
LLIRSVRRLLRAGYRHDDLVHALELELGQRREELEFTAGGQEPTRWERTMRSKMYASLAIAAVTGASAAFVPYPATLIACGLFALSCATAVATGLAAMAASRSRLGDAEARGLRFWGGRFGRWLFGLAHFRLGSRLPVAAGDRPTEAALGVAAVELFEALPETVRHRLGDLPRVVRDLEDKVQRLRRNGRAADVQGALSALETIRLDLLRLHGGVGTVDGLTADLGAARAIGAQVDALLGA